MSLLVSRARCLVSIVLLCGLGLPACGGGGGGGGSGGGGGGSVDPPSDSVVFTGFSFRSGSGVVTTTPPQEDPTAIPPTVGAALNLTLIFQFSGVPEGPFNQTSLRVFTTPADVTPAAGASSNAASIPAKGSYVQVGNTVEFRPFVPSAPLQINLSAPPEAVPGLLPGSTYTLIVSTAQGAKLPNLNVPGIVVPTVTQIGTTSNPAAYYVTDTLQGASPRVLASVPADGGTDFFPGTFATKALDSNSATFPPGPEDIYLTYQVPVMPTLANLAGEDVDGDGLVDAAFAFRARATRLIVSHTLPDGAFGPTGPIPSLSGFEEAPGAIAPSDGTAVILFGGSFPASQTLLGTLSSLSAGADASLLFGILPVAGGSDRLTVVDHVLGDPSSAEIGVINDGGVATGLDDVVGLTSLLDGRLVGYDRTTREIVELIPVVTRARAAPGSPAVGAPNIQSLTLGDGITGFRSQPQSDVTGDVRDLFQAPSGTLYALAVLAGETLPAIIRLVPIDFDANGIFEADEGLFSGDEADVVLRLSSDYTDIALLDETSVLGLDRPSDAVDQVDLTAGAVVRVLSGVAGFGQPLPDGLSPALALSVGHLTMDADVAQVGSEVALMQRNGFTSLFGANAVNEDPEGQISPLGARELLTLTTAAPILGLAAVIDDVFTEPFDNKVYEDSSLLSTAPKADWAAAQSGGITTGGLRASVGVSETAQLGDFLPTALGNFDPSKAYVRAGLPWPNHGVDDKEERDLDFTATAWRTILLNTDAQSFPLSSGATPSITEPITILGGRFSFRDFIIPEGVQVVVKGSNPLIITATGRVEIHGMLDVSGVDGLGDNSFDSGFLPVRGGPGGPGAGRGGDGHPTLADPNGPGGIDQYVTPETGENGYAPVIGPSGSVSFKKVGGRGGLSTLGYTPNAQGYPLVPAAQANGNVGNDENHRPPGGGGGSYYTRGDPSHNGAGTYLVQSSSTWFPFTKCPTNDKIHDATYGNEENFYSGKVPNTPVQCVYMTGPPENPVRLKPGAAPGDRVFVDGDPTNDYIGPGGELAVPLGGQGGGGGGTRIDSMRHSLWSLGSLGEPVPLPFSPPFYPNLSGGTYFFSPTVFDAKGGGGGGGGGAVQIRCFSDILIGRTGHIDASGGHGGGGEVVENSQIGGGGGGGSGGAILLQAAGSITIQAQKDHKSASYTDNDGLEGASLEVSGGFGRDAQTDTPTQNFNLSPWTYDFTRSDGGQGGMGLIQLQSGDGSAMPIVEEGAFLFAKKRSVLKRGTWTGDSLATQRDHPDVYTTSPPPTDLWYVDMLHYRTWRPEGVPFVPFNYYYVLNGSFPPLISSQDGSNDQGLVNQYPGGSGQFWADTPMIEHAGRMLVQEPTPQWIMKTYEGFDPVTLTELNSPPGTLYGSQDKIPFSIYLNEPAGTPIMKQVDGQLVFDPDNTIDRLPVVSVETAPPPFGTVSQGRSRWLDFNGVVTRLRDAGGRTPPFFGSFHGTHNPGHGAVPAGKDGQVSVGANIVGKPAKAVTNAGGFPFDPGLFGNGAGLGDPPDPPYNDVKVDAPDASLLLQDAISNNATVSVRFQGAYPVRAGSGTPDPDTFTAWVSDLSQLTGFPLVRFDVVFDVGVDPVAFPFGVGSYRPKVDYVRVRASY